MKTQTWKTELHTCNKCCNAAVKAGQKYCDKCNKKAEIKKDQLRLVHILQNFGFKLS